MNMEEYRASLPPPPLGWGGTGAIWVPPSPKDYPVEWHPKIAHLLQVGAPGEADRSPGCFEILNQGNTGACVVYSTCQGLESDNFLESQKQYRTNPALMYTQMGGNGGNGIDSRAELQACVDSGAPLQDGGRLKIASYFRLDAEPNAFKEQVKAAIAAGQVVVLALLLPSTFGGIWTPGTVTSGYHQLCVLGYRVTGDDVLIWGPNSWGSGWPSNRGSHPAGFFELSLNWIVADGMQRGYAYGFVFDPFVAHGPLPDPQPKPEPKPVPKPEPKPEPKPVIATSIKAAVTGGDAITLAEGQTLTVGNYNVTLLITDVERREVPGPGPKPAPKPEPEPEPAPGGLTVVAQAGSLGRSAALFAEARDTIGVAAASIELFAWGVSQGGRVSRRDFPARWIKTWRTGDTLHLVAHDAQGRQGEITLSAP